MIQFSLKLIFLFFIHTSIMFAVDGQKQNKADLKSNELSFDDSITIFEPEHQDPTLNLAASTPDCLDFIRTPRTH